MSQTRNLVVVYKSAVSFLKEHDLPIVVRVFYPPRQDFRPPSGARMTQSRSVLVLLVALILSVSFAVPAEDVPETAYDDSESLPCESTPVVSIAAPKAVGEAPAVRAGTSQLLRTSLKRLEVRRSECWAGLPCTVSHFLIVLDRSFRC